MGASEWRYFVPYQPDIQKAFESLQRAIFANWNYEHREPIPFHILQQGFEIMYSPSELTESERIEAREALYKPYQKPIQLPHHASIRELVASCGEDGTGTILDMYRVSFQKGYGVCAPLTPIQLVSYFGTDKPTYLMIEEALEKPFNFDYFDKLTPIKEFGLDQYLQQVADRWRGQGTYIIVYKDDKPDEILFFGYSGD